MIARGLVRAGVEVIISSRKADACAAAVEELSQYGTASAIPADLSSEAGTTALAAGVAEAFPALHLLVNNAGATWGAPIGEFPDDAWDRVMDTNVRGIFNLTQSLLGPLRAAASDADPARVINIGSIDGIRTPMTENYSYSASKAAVHMLTKHLSKRLAGERITVNAIAPGPFPSKMTAFMLASEESRAAVDSMVPLGRIGDEDDIVGATIFLASRAGAYLTGTTIPVDGGITGTT
ncbi:MAG: SDR family oxidoreductase [Solirubrobacteraceae bacterium]|nr:SDR family oxidoreductase [Solirubrobacteraceae bacterium]